jgi:tRNA uridine 5-carboxymethylaminomethyl modification enzyme
MFTSRAEYRTLLRQDNADLRLTPLANKIGLANKQRMGLVNKKKIQTKSLIDFYKKTSVKPDEINNILVNKKTPIIKQSEKLFKIYSRPNILFKEMGLINKVKAFIEKNSIEENAIEQAEVSIKYSGYIKKELNNVKKLKKLERLAIPNAFNYDILPSLSSEAKEKLNRVRPKSISQASRISGIKPSDLSVILVELGR